MFFKIAAPVLAAVAQRAIRNDLQRLKPLLEQS